MAMVTALAATRAMPASTSLSLRSGLPLGQTKGSRCFRIAMMGFGGSWEGAWTGNGVMTQQCLFDCGLGGLKIAAWG